MIYLFKYIGFNHGFKNDTKSEINIFLSTQNIYQSTKILRWRVENNIVELKKNH